MVDLSVVVLHYNKWALTRDCLDALLRHPWPDGAHELVVIDNGSTMLNRLTQTDVSPWGARLVRYDENAGNIGGTNRAFWNARGEWVLFVANDVRVHVSCLEHLWFHRMHADILQPVLYQPDGAIDNAGITWRWPGYGTRVRDRGQRMDAFANTCVLMKRSTWQLVGMFDERLVSSHEDVDFSLRARALGYRIEACWLAQATHLMNQTLGHVGSPTMHAARLRTVDRNYRGLRRWARRAAVQALDGLAASIRPRSPDAPGTSAAGRRR